MHKPTVVSMWNLRAVISLASVLIISSALASGQTDTGSIKGTVTDPSGSVIQEAQVTATETQSGTTYKAATSSDGYYTINSARPGSYTINVSAPGFATSENQGIRVFIGTSAAQDFQLHPGATTETIEVTANGPGVETETSDIGTVITPEQVRELPLAVGGQLRSLSTLAFLAPGAVGPGTNGGVQFTKIAGGQTEGSDFLLDGISTLRSENGSGQFDQTTPSVEAIQEFRIETSSLPADLGRTTGGIVNFKSSSGTNSYHGVVYDFYKNAALDANNWFNNGNLALATTPAGRARFKRSPDTKNDYGITMGGPVVIPHLYNGRNKTFFFFSWEELRYGTGQTHFDTVPTQAMRNGDFSALLGGPLSGGPGNPPPVNPCTGQVLLSGQIFDPSTTRTVGGVPCRDPFPNNQVPVGNSQIAQKVLAYVPLPNLPGLQGNYAFRETEHLTNDVYSIRVDQNVGTRNRLFGFFNSRENFDSGNPNFPLPIDSGAQLQDLYSKYSRAGWDFTISPTLLNAFSLGGNRINSFNNAIVAAQGKNFDQILGIANTTGAGTTFPQFNVGEGIQQFGEANFDDNVDNAIIGNDVLNWQRGAHSLRVGATYRWQQFSYINSGPSAGNFTFGRAQTAVDPNFTADTGNGFASFLLGQPGSISRTIQVNTPRWISHYYALFLQDDWKARPNLTFNLGLRWSVDTPRHEASGGTSSLNPTLPNTGANGFPGALAFGGTGTGRNGNRTEAWANTYYKDFEPRVGFSWAPGALRGKHVFRGSYEIFYGPLVYADFGQGLTQGFTQNLSYTGAGNGFFPNGPLDAGFPAATIGVNVDPTQQNGRGIDYVAKSHARPAMVQNWSLETQTQFAPDLVFTLGYIGQHSTRLHALLNFPNDIPLQDLALGDTLFAGINSPQAAAAGISAPFANFTTIWGPNAQVQQALRQFPQYGYINTDSYLQNSGQSTYNALEAKLERRFKNGLTLLASYTWSKTLTDSDSIQPFFSTVLGQGGTQNPYNLRAEKAVSTQDVPQNFVISYLYELPVGRGKKFLGNSPRAVNAVLGGWRVGGIQRYVSGQPISFFGANGIPGFDNGIRFNRVPGQNPLSPYASSGHFDPFASILDQANPAKRYFNRAAFLDPNANRNGGAYQFGTMPRNSADIRSFAFYNEDLSINKTFPIHESVNMEFRAEMFNAFNRHIFNKPDSGPNDGSFGQVTSTLNAPRNVQFVLKINY